jgi:hypothetical protein
LACLDRVNLGAGMFLTFAKALHVTTDQLLGFEPSTKTLIQQVIDGFLAGQGEEAVSQSR